MMQQNKSQLNWFIDDMEAIIRKYAMESDILQRAKPLLEELLRSPDSMLKNHSNQGKTGLRII